MLIARREVFLWAGLAVASAASGLACSKPPPPEPKKAPPTWPRTTTHESVEMIELFPQGADESSPLVVAIHGRGDKPENWIEGWSAFPEKAWIVLPRAPIPWGPPAPPDGGRAGTSWFELHDGMTDAELGASVGDAETKLWRGVSHLMREAKKKKLIVTGFSQGGILSFAIAARHPIEVAHAIPVAGSLAGPLLPKNKALAAPLFAMHGTEDKVIRIEYGRGAVNAFKEQGNDATLKEYPGVGHQVTAEMRNDWRNALLEVLPKAR